MYIDMQMRIGRNLKLLRTLAKDSLSEVAAKLAISKSCYCHIEQGESMPDLSTLRAAAQLYQAPVETLVNSDIAHIMSDYLLHREYTKTHSRFLTLYYRLSYPGKDLLIKKAKALMQEEAKRRIASFRITNYAFLFSDFEWIPWGVFFF